MAVQTVGRTRPQTARDQALGRLERRGRSKAQIMQAAFDQVTKPAKARDAGTSSKKEIAERNGKRHTIIEQSTTGLVEENAAAARKYGVLIKTWERGVRQGKPVTTFYVVVDGGRLRALSGNFDSAAAAKKAVSAAGLKVVES